MTCNERCEMLARAQAIETKKGLDASNAVCPFFDVCKGNLHYMFDPEDSEENVLVAESLRKLQIHGKSDR